MNKIEKLVMELIGKYELRSVVERNEIWIAINDLGLPKQTRIDVLNKIKKFYNTSNDEKILKSSHFSEVRKSVHLNFNPNTLNNNGEKFVNFKLFNLVLMNTNSIGMEYKIGVTYILEQIRKNDYYVDRNTSKENYDKLMNEIEVLEKELEKTKKIKGDLKTSLMGCYGNLVHLPKFCKSNNYDIEEVTDYMKKNKWIDDKGRVLNDGMYPTSKVLKDKKNYFLSDIGMELIQGSVNRKTSRDIRKKLIEEYGITVEDLIK